MSDVKLPIHTDVLTVAKLAKQAGQEINIDYRLPTVDVKINEDEGHFFQGEEADNLIEEARKSFLHLFCSVEDIILWQAQGW